MSGPLLVGRRRPAITILGGATEADEARWDAENTEWEQHYNRIRVMLDAVILYDYASGGISFEDLARRALKCVETLPKSFGKPKRMEIFGNFIAMALRAKRAKRTTTGRRPAPPFLNTVLKHWVNHFHSAGRPLKRGPHSAFNAVVGHLKKIGYHVTEAQVINAYYAGKVLKRAKKKNISRVKKR